MEFKSIMHISFFTNRMEEMRDFYENKLGMKPKIVTKAKAYLDTKNPMYSQMAGEDPEKVLIIYLEAAPGQFIELFPGSPDQGPHPEWNKNLGYTHFSLLVEDIYKAKEEFIAAGIAIDDDISKGPSETYKFWFHDPDGNKCELMQYTKDSYQVVGNIM